MTTSYHINDTASYHRDRMKTLGWELTVCNTIEDASSPCRGVIHKNGSFGKLLLEHLAETFPLETVSSVIEIGGGYGFIMRDFIAKKPGTPATMLDLSPVMLAKQKETLINMPVEFLHDDFFNVDASFFGRFDLVLMNEIVGDFPTVCDIDPEILKLPDDELDPPLANVKRIFSTYGLPVPDKAFNLNTGAIEAIEKLLSAGVRYLYLSEHSCESEVTDVLKNRVHISGTGNPERIPLMGHDEYTIKFSHLEQVVRKFGYRIKRGQYKDFITFDCDGRLNFILTSNSQKEEHEIIRQFIEDLYKYEYLIAMRD
jgi:hypothetical protein